MGFLSLFGGSVVSSVEKIATELIETDKESAEAKAIFIKTLDPNGLMRRDISSTVRNLYSLYIVTMLSLIVLQFFGVGNQETVAVAVEGVKGLFTEVTTAFIAIVGASFGVNGLNAHKGK